MINYIIIILAIFSPLITTHAQSPVLTNLNGFSICDFNPGTGNEENCTEHEGNSVYTKVEVIPDQSITLYLKNPEENGKTISKIWDDSDLTTNHSNNLLIYKFLKGNLNVNNGISLYILMRPNYSVQNVICTVNQNGNILIIKSNG